MGALTFSFAAIGPLTEGLNFTFMPADSSPQGLLPSFVAADVQKVGLIFEFATRAPIGALLPKGQKCRFPY